MLAKTPSSGPLGHLLSDGAKGVAFSLTVTVAVVAIAITLAFFTSLFRGLFFPSPLGERVAGAMRRPGEGAFCKC